MRTAPAQLELYSTKVLLLLSASGPEETRFIGFPCVRELAARFAWPAKRLAVLGAATAEPTRRRVLARVRSFILIGEELELKT
jgi:hypothetical protein